jgi:hypothetical protein
MRACPHASCFKEPDAQFTPRRDTPLQAKATPRPVSCYAGLHRTPRFGMSVRQRPLLMALALTLLLWADAAPAQSPGCELIRAELAALPQGNSAQPLLRQVQRHQAELDRLIGYARSIGCQNRRFLMFGNAPPPQCGSLEAQIGQLEATIAALEGEASRRSGQGRRAQLTAAFDRQCRGQPAGQPGFFEGLFGGRPPDPIPQEPAPEFDQAEEDNGFSGSFKTMCVRACDGFYFPMATAATQASFAGQAELCQAACPGAAAELFVQRPGSEVAAATSLDGTPYASLPNAFRYRQTYDATCSCRNQGQSWSQALAQAEAMLAGRSSDVIVTEETSQALSRVPRPATQAPAKQPKKPKTEPPPGALGATAPGAVIVDPAVSAAAASGAAAPTAGQEVSGIGGPQRDRATIGVGEGETRQITTPGGDKKSIRIVAPTLAPTPAPP